MSLFFSVFFFLMLRRPPRSTLFPSRRSSDLPRGEPRVHGGVPVGGKLEGLQESDLATLRRENPRLRSEEHTSELQSLRHLVCRLLLEKKKTTKLINTCPHHSHIHTLRTSL